jgi:NAD(P)-dependent dehydrogenase (short-subunit alcohol dehydrogenase family)
MKKLLLHTLPGPKAEELFKEFQQHTESVYLSRSGLIADAQVATDLATDLATEDQESLIIAFPDEYSQGDLSETIDKVLTSSFLEIQKFVQIRMKKRFGQILCLVNAGANGLLYGESGQNHVVAAQGGLIGLTKTISKEYSKRGIIANVLYIDWNNIPLSEIVIRSKSFLTDNTQLKGQVLALDGGRWL